MENFSNIPSQFDDIPPGHPVVFISYSWDSDEHKAWVKKLSDDLRSKYAVCTLLDQYNRGGYDLIEFMTKGVQKSDRVLLIGTPEYRKKLEEDSGGVKYEDQLITIKLYHEMGSSKFIPVLRAGKFDTSFSPIIETRTGYSMVEDGDYEKTLEKIAADLWNDPVNAAPALGPKPSFGSTKTYGYDVVDETKELTVTQFVEEVKRLLSTPNSEIAYTEMIEVEGKKAYEKILEKANYNFTINSTNFKSYKEFHIHAVERLVAASIVIVRYGTQKQQELLIDVMKRLCLKPFINGEQSEEGTPIIHLFGATFLFHTIGISSVKYGYFQILPMMMRCQVPASNALSPSRSYSLAHLAGTNHWQSDLLNIYMDASWLYPYSELVSRTLQPYFKEYFLNDDEYKNSYAIWEHLFSMMYVYYKSSILKDNEIFPIGLFLGERIMRNSFIEGDSYSNFFAAAAIEKDNWTPLQQGLFDGSYAQYDELYQRAETYYQKNRRW